MTAVKGIVSDPTGRVDKWQVFLAVMLGLLILVISVAVFWLLIDDSPPAVINGYYLLDENGERTTSIVVFPGDEFSFFLDWCKKTTASEIVRTTWVNDFIENETPFFPVYISPGCHETAVQRTVPMSIRGNSVYSMGISIFYEVNPIMERHVNFKIDGIVVEIP